MKHDMDAESAQYEFIDGGLNIINERRRLAKTPVSSVKKTT